MHRWRPGPWPIFLVDDFYPYGRTPRAKTTAPNVDPQALATYAGTYEMADGGRVVARVENGKLVSESANPFGKTDITLDPITDTTFSAFRGELEVTFIRSAAGNVTEVISDFRGQRPVSCRFCAIMPPHLTPHVRCGTLETGSLDNKAEHRRDPDSGADWFH